MPDYRRWYVPGGTVFFTVVTYERRRLFADVEACRLLGTIMRRVRRELPFRTVAAVLLPDHLHAVWSLPEADADYSRRWQRIKRDFTVARLANGGVEATTSAEQEVRRNRGIWQKRFFERQVRDTEELERICDYVHYNAVKHGYVAAPLDWPQSTFHRFVKAGQYDVDWGRGMIDSELDFDCE